MQRSFTSVIVEVFFRELHPLLLVIELRALQMEGDEPFLFLCLSRSDNRKMDNPVIRTLLNHRSVRKYKPDQPPEKVVKTIVRAGQQAPFSSQYMSCAPRSMFVPFRMPLTDDKTVYTGQTTILRSITPFKLFFNLFN
jgi:hypothetical protein